MTWLIDKGWEGGYNRTQVTYISEITWGWGGGGAGSIRLSK